MWWIVGKRRSVRQKAVWSKKKWWNDRRMMQVPPNSGGILNLASTHLESFVGQIGISGFKVQVSRHARKRSNLNTWDLKLETKG